MIIKCLKCRKTLHRSERCPFCGNTADFNVVSDDIMVHENVVHEYEKLKEFLKQKRFEEAEKVSQKILEWMPTCSNVFWLRMLANNKCKDDNELIQKGIFFERNAEYYNALKYGSDIEKDVYLGISELMNQIKEQLIVAITHHEYDAKRSTAIFRCSRELSEQIVDSQKILLKIWTDLEKTEAEIHIYEEKCKQLIQEFIDNYEQAKREVLDIKNQIDKMNECTEENLHRYHVGLGKALLQAECAKDDILCRKKEHPWVKKYMELCQRRDEMVRQIDSELLKLKSYEKLVQSTILEVEKIEKKHQDVLKEIVAYNFVSACTLLGSEQFTRILNEAGFCNVSTKLTSKSISIYSDGSGYAKAMIDDDLRNDAYLS